MKYVYPAVFGACDEGGFSIHFPDLPGTNSQGEDLYDALYMAELALGEWLDYLAYKNMEIPAASKIGDIKLEIDEFASLIRAEIKKSA